MKKLRKTFPVGIGGDISLKCDCHADFPLSLNTYCGDVAMTSPGQTGWRGWILDSSLGFGMTVGG